MKIISKIMKMYRKSISNAKAKERNDNINEMKERKRINDNDENQWKRK